MRGRKKLPTSLPQESNLTSVQAVDEAEQREVDGSTQELDKGLEVDDTNQVTEDHVDGKEAGERDEEGEESKKRASKANKLWNWWRKMWTAPRNTQLRSQHEKEDDPGTGPKKDPDEAEEHQEQEEEKVNLGDAEACGAETETSSDPEEEGEKHKAPDEERRPVKTINDTVVMASLTRDKEGTIFGAETADLEREGKKLELAGEAT